jgi:hypothetical protein
MRLGYLSFAALLAATAPATADALAPYQAENIELGGIGGVAYYVEEPDGFRIVATLVEGETGPPVRFEATLAVGQKFTVSVPGRLGEAARFVEFLRAGDRLLVEESRQSPLSRRRGPHAPEG